MCDHYCYFVLTGGNSWSSQKSRSRCVGFGERRRVFVFRSSCIFHWSSSPQGKSTSHWKEIPGFMGGGILVFHSLYGDEYTGTAWCRLLYYLVPKEKHRVVIHVVYSRKLVTMPRNMSHSKAREKGSARQASQGSNKRRTRAIKCLRIRGGTYRQPVVNYCHITCLPGLVNTWTSPPTRRLMYIILGN